jgi:hypothetical protein
MEVKNQKAGDSSQNIQGNNVTVNIFTVVQSVKDIAPQILENSFGELSEESKEMAQAQQEDFIKSFQTRIEKISSDIEELQKAVNKPDFQYMAKKSLIAAGRMGSPAKRGLLASLLGDRLNTKTEFGEIVYNEALETIPKLTDRQIKMLAIVCDINLITGKNNSTWDDFNADKKQIFKFALPLDFRHADLQHIAYSGCGTISPFETPLLQAIKERDQNLFLKPISSEEPEFSEIKGTNLIAFFIEKDGHLYFRANKNRFEEVLKTTKGADPSVAEKIRSLYASKTMNDTEAMEQLTANCFMAKELIDVWDSRQLKRLSLTSVGTIVGVSVIEEITKKEISKDEWLGLAPEHI